AKTEELRDLIEWLGELVRQVDSSLLDEWVALTAGAPPAASGSWGPGSATETGPPAPPDATTDARALHVVARSEAGRRAPAGARGGATCRLGVGRARQRHRDGAAASAGRHDERARLPRARAQRGVATGSARGPAA